MGKIGMDDDGRVFPPALLDVKYASHFRILDVYQVYCFLGNVKGVCSHSGNSVPNVADNIAAKNMLIL